MNVNELDYDWVFAFGSNMNLNDLKRWFTENGFEDAIIKTIEPAHLPSYSLIWNHYASVRKGGAANIKPIEGRDLPGLALYVDKLALKAIDIKEGHPDVYSRGDTRRRLQLFSGKSVHAWVYAVSSSHTSLEIIPPRKEYLNLLIQAAEKYKFPNWYLDELKKTPVIM